MAAARQDKVCSAAQSSQPLAAGSISVATIQDIVRSAAKTDKNRRSLGRCIRDFSVSLYFLALNWKPCLLFDFGAASDDTLLSIRETGCSFTYWTVLND